MKEIDATQAKVVAYGSVAVQAPEVDTPTAPRDNCPPLKVINGRLMKYGYCVSKSWIREYGRERGIKGETDAVLDLVLRSDSDYRYVMVPSLCVYWKRTLNGKAKSAFCRHLVTDREGFELAYLYSSGSNESAASMEEALNPRRIQKLKELMRMEREPKWLYTTRVARNDQP
ncbi:unnamed protein product [Somion occarium]|uniref:Uncharacterized protein n=1 Tax=Somion occarium TaxID=3059160 RepID=A0ABP1CUL5_9APHY